MDGKTSSVLKMNLEFLDFDENAPGAFDQVRIWTREGTGSDRAYMNQSHVSTLGRFPTPDAGTVVTTAPAPTLPIRLK